MNPNREPNAERADALKDLADLFAATRRAIEKMDDEGYRAYKARQRERYPA